MEEQNNTPPPTEANNMDQLLTELALLKDALATMQSGLLSKGDVERIVNAIIDDRPTVEEVKKLVNAAQDATSLKLKKQFEDFAQRMEKLSNDMQEQFAQSIGQINAKHAALDTSIKPLEKLSGQMEVFLTLIQRTDQDVKRLDDRLNKRDEVHEQRIAKVESAQSVFIEEKTELRAGVQRIADQVIAQKTDTNIHLTRIEASLASQAAAINTIQTEWLGLISFGRKALTALVNRKAATAVFTVFTGLGLTKFAELFNQFVQLIGQ
jgi:vacuolar-type H+-ATPase subunit I/STV1